MNKQTDHHPTDIGQLADRWLRYLREQKYSPKSVTTYRYPLECFLSFLAEHHRQRIQDVTESELIRYRQRLLDRKFSSMSVELYMRTVRHLESYLTAIRPFLVRDPKEMALFLNRSGNRLPYHTFLRLVHRYGDKANIDVHVTPHTFRRSCTTELIRGGANLYHVKELLGHESLETLKAYTKLTITDLKKTHAKCHPREKKE